MPRVSWNSNVVTSSSDVTGLPAKEGAISALHWPWCINCHCQPNEGSDWILWKLIIFWRLIGVVQSVRCLGLSARIPNRQTKSEVRKKEFVVWLQDWLFYNSLIFPTLWGRFDLFHISLSCCWSKDKVHFFHPPHWGWFPFNWVDCTSHWVANEMQREPGGAVSFLLPPQNWSKNLMKPDCASDSIWDFLRIFWFQ